MTNTFPTSGTLLDAIQVIHGPAALMGRLFLQADRAARDCGITLSFGAPDELAAINRANRATWRPIVPIFCTETGFGAANGFALLGRNAAGEIVATQGARVYDWAGTSFREEAESLRMFYGAEPPPAAESCRVRAPSSSSITGTVAFSGAGWYRPDFRGKGLAAILPRVSRALAYTRCATDFTISIMADAVAAGGMAVRAGYTHIEGSVELINSPVGPFRGVLIWMPKDELLRDVRHFLGGAAKIPAEVDAVAQNRSAHDTRVA
jgi:hypothetical protein